MALLLIAFTLFRPGFWLDMIQPPFIEHPGKQILQMVQNTEPGKLMRIKVAGPDLDNPDRIKSTLLQVEVKDGRTPMERLRKSGLMITMEGDAVKLEEPMPGTPFFHLSQKFDFYADKPVVITNVYEPAKRMPKEVFYIPALLLLGLVIASQLRRRRLQGEAAGAAA